MKKSLQVFLFVKYIKKWALGVKIRALFVTGQGLKRTGKFKGHLLWKEFQVKDKHCSDSTVENLARMLQSLKWKIRRLIY